MGKEDELLGRKVKERFPNIYQELRPMVERPMAMFRHLNRLRILRQLYCEYQQVDESTLVGINKETNRRESSEHKELFIAVIIKLYNPEIITGYDEKIMDGLCEELSDILECNRVQVSDFAQGIRLKLNPEKNMNAYAHFKQVVADVSAYMVGQFKGNEPFQGEMFLQ